MAGVPLGIHTSVRRDSWATRLLLSGSLVGISIPPFLLGTLLILAFSVTLPWLPSCGRGAVVSIGGWWTTGFASWSGVRALILPAVTLALLQMTLIVRLVRAEMLDVLQSDYIRFARARGLGRRTIYFGHALRNVLVPVISIIGLQFGGLVAFALVTETVFQWPGLGLLLVQSVAAADIPVLSAYLLMTAALFLSINLVVDLLYFAIDPRLRAGWHRR
jgi:peptide/nickel transport system permease protein